MREVKVGDNVWRESKRGASDKTVWTSNYICSDGDYAEMLIGDGSFELHCFSGIPASHIYVDDVDFGVFQCAPNKVDGLDFREPFENQCARIADHLCSKFCILHEESVTII